MPEGKDFTRKGSNLLNLLMFRYLPYWPLFVILELACFLVSWNYISSITPVYEAVTTILIKDEKQGSGDSKLLESLNIAPSNKNLGNEIEIIRSKALMKEVVNKLSLYSPIFEKSSTRLVSAYNSSPIMIKLKEPNRVVEREQIPFSYDEKSKTVSIDNHIYILNVWATTNYGTLMFTKNDRQSSTTSEQLCFSLRQPDSLASTYCSKLNIVPVNKNSSVIALKITDEVPERAENILNTLADVYTRASIADKNALSFSTLSFLEDRIKYIESDLDSIERRIQGYKSQKGIIDLSAQGKIFLESVSSNDRKIGDINVNLAILDQVESYVVNKGSQAGIVPSTMGLNEPLLTDLLQKLYSAEVLYERLKKTSSINNPALISVKSEIDQIRPSILEIIHNQKESLLVGVRNLNASNESYTSILSKIPKQEKDLLDFSRRQAIKSSVYTFLLQKREETALSFSAAIADNRVIDVAKASIIPNSPNKATIYILAIAFGILVGIAFITIKDFGNTKILFRSEIERYTTVPIVAELAKVKEKRSLVVNNSSHAFISEQFRQLRAAIGLHGRSASKIRLLVTSSISGEGKSFVSSNLALSLALAGKKTALVDIDLRNPKISEIFALNASRGVAEYLEGKAETFEIIKQTKYNHLFVVPSGRGTTNPTELLLNGKIDALINSLAEIFDYIIIDTSPIDPVTDAYILSQYCDSILFVIRHGFTPKTTVQLLDESNKIKALKNLNIVFNGVKSRGFKAYGYGYGYGYEKISPDAAYARKNRARQV